MKTPIKIEDILQFWFGAGDNAGAVAAEKSALWWSKNEQVDREIATRFGATSAAASNAELDYWGDTPAGLLALIICTDQFPRNIHRDTPQAFASDEVALRFARQCVDSGMAEQLKPIERVFVYLPFEHSEALVEQQRSIALYQALVQNVNADEAEIFNNFLEFARKHYDIIERFNRFPHRNQILGRHSTTEELTFLKQPDSSF